MAKAKSANTISACLILLAGVVVGSFLADLVRDVEGLSWLAYGGSFGIGSGAPLVLDLSVVRLTFGLSFHLTIAVILCVAAAFAIWRKWL